MVDKNEIREGGGRLDDDGKGTQNRAETAGQR